MRTGILNKRTTFLFFARLLLRSNFYSRFSSPRSCGHDFPVPAVYIIISRGECGMTMSSACVDGETERERDSVYEGLLLRNDKTSICARTRDQ